MRSTSSSPQRSVDSNALNYWSPGSYLVKSYRRFLIISGQAANRYNHLLASSVLTERSLNLQLFIDLNI